MQPKRWNLTAHFSQGEDSTDPDCVTFDLDFKTAAECKALVVIFAKHERFMGAFINRPDGTCAEEYAVMPAIPSR